MTILSKNMTKLVFSIYLRTLLELNFCLKLQYICNNLLQNSILTSIYKMEISNFLLEFKWNDAIIVVIIIFFCIKYAKFFAIVKSRDVMMKMKYTWQVYGIICAFVLCCFLWLRGVLVSICLLLIVVRIPSLQSNK